MINHIVVVGRLTRDPKIYSNQGKHLATFSLAVDRHYKYKTEHQACDYLNCKALGTRALNVKQYLSQGALVAIIGHLQSSKYDKVGQTHFITEILVETIKFLSPKSLTQVSATCSPNPIGLKL